MALDQFLMKIEETFSVDLMADEAESAETLNELVSYLEKHTAKMPHSQEEAEQMLLNGITSLQNFLAKELDIDVLELTPTTDLEPFLKPLSKRRRIWNKMRQEISVDIPPMASSVYQWLGGGIAIVIGILVAISVVIGQKPTNPNPLPIAILLSCLAGFLAALMSYAAGSMVFASCFSALPADCRTVERIVRYVVSTAICLDPNGQQWTRKSLEKAVLRIASKTSGIPKEKIDLSMKINDT